MHKVTTAGIRLAAATEEPQVVLELLVVGLAHLEVEVGLIVEVLVLSPQLLSACQTLSRMRCLFL